MPQAPATPRHFDGLVDIVKTLRGPDGCPWDKEQTHQSLARFAQEEVAELVEAIEAQNPESVCEELGDVLLQVVLHAQIASEAQHFTIQDVIASIAGKMIHRHPHVFGDAKLESSAEVRRHWQQLKATEKKTKPLSSGLPLTLPALLASQKIGERTKQFKFDWENLKDVIHKVEEELAELKQALADSTREEQVKELGDLLFSLAQLARHLGADAEQSLRQTNRRFENRFACMQALMSQAGVVFATATPAILETYWQKAKQEEKS